MFVQTSYMEMKLNLKVYYTGCPKSSFLCFISLYFSTIGLGKQIIQQKVAF